jgi:nucleotide-binding universal stress UspA family protein
MFKKILIPTDGSDLSNGAATAAIGLARESGASVFVLNIQPIYQPPIVAEVPVAGYYSQDEYEKSALEVGSRVVAAIAAQAGAASVACKTLVRLDPSPWEAIIRVAREEGCDLIFMASHGRRGMAGLLLGSETQKVLTHCKIPVLVYR